MVRWAGFTRNLDAVALTGDLHSYAAGYLKPDYGESREPAEWVGVEFLAPAVSSANLRETLDLPDNRLARSFVEHAVRDENPHVQFFDSHHWGYAVVEFTPDAATYTGYAVDKSVPAQDATRRTLAALEVPAGTLALRRL